MKNMSVSRVMVFAVISLAILSLAAPSSAQQGMAPAAPSAPLAQQAPAAPAAQSAQPAAPSDVAATPAEREGRLLKAAAAELKELSPWSMFKSADVLVKAVMLGLAFASLVTWTIFIAKMIELSVIQRKLRSALAKIVDARSLAEAQFALGAKGSVLASFLAAAMRERGCRPVFRATPASRSAPHRALAKSCAPRRRIPARHGPVGNHRRDVALRPDCSAPSGAS
jgi:biopolymer transport protein ExbB